jgi:hypothetical protein
MITITYDGITDTITGWANRTKIPATTIRSRFEYGWTPDRILTQPVKKHRQSATTPQYVRADLVQAAEQRGYANAMEAERKLHEARITALTAERDEWRKAYHKTHDLYASSEERADALAERLAKAVEALTKIADRSSEMVWGEGGEILEAMYDMESIAEVTLAELKGDTP